MIERLKFLRRTAHVASMITLFVLAPLSSQARPFQAQAQKSQPATRDQQTAPPPINITVVAPEKTTEERDEGRNNTAQQIAIQQQIAKYTKALVVVGFLDVIAIAFGLAYTARAANAAKKSAHIAETALILTERAYIDVVDFKIDALAVGKAPRVNFRVRNSGRTPARHASVAGSSHYGPERPAAPTAAITKTLQNVFIAASGAIGCPINLPIIETQDVLNVVLGGGLWLFVEAKYTAAGIPDERTFRVCLTFSGPLQELVLDNDNPYSYAD